MGHGGGGPDVLGVSLSSLPHISVWFFPVFFNGVHLHVESPQSSVSATRGGTIILPCHFHYEPEIVEPRRTRVKWSWLPASTIYVPADASTETEVFVAIGNRHRSYGNFRGRVRLCRSVPGDLSLVIDRLQVSDMGRYRCEVIDGLEDKSVTVELKLRGVCEPVVVFYTRTPFLLIQ